MKRLVILFFTLFAFALHAQQDSVDVARNDSIMGVVSTLKAIEIKIPRLIYSMDAGVVSYNVSSDEAIRGGNALDAFRNAPSVEVDVNGNVRLRGSSKVQIWMNGYPTHMNGESLRIYLTSLPAEVIDHIEVIKNPSAEYLVDEGTAIINIVMSVKLRRNQFLAVGLSGNDRPYASPWASYVFDGDKLDFNVYMAPSLSHGNTVRNGESWSFCDNASGDKDTTQIQRWNTTDSNFTSAGIFNLGATYVIDSMNDVTLTSFALFQGFDTKSVDDRYRTEILPIYQPLHYITKKDDDFINANGFSTLNFRHKFDNHGHNISFTVNTNWRYSTFNSMTNRLFDAYYPDELRKSASQNSTLDPSFTLRYRRPVGKHDNISVGVGYSPHRSRTFAYGSYFDSLPMAYSLGDTLRNRETDTRDREEYVSLNWNHRTSAYSTSMGVIAEAHQIDYSVQSFMPEELRLDYMAVRPTLNFTCHTKSMHYFSANYVMSTKHPSPKQLSVSPAYQYDSYTIGNPLLKPYVTHKADVGWNKYFKSGNSISVEAYGEWNNNTIEAVLDATSTPDPYLARVVPFTTYYNIGSSKKYGVESNASYRVNAFLQFRIYANLYYSAYQIDHPKTGVLGDSALTYDLRLNCSAKLFKKVYVNLSGNYTSPTISPFAEKRSNYAIDFSTMADFLDDRLSVTLSVSDLFNWNKTNLANTNPYYVTTESTHRDSRYVTFGVVYRIGKMNLQYRSKSGAGLQ